MKNVLIFAACVGILSTGCTTIDVVPDIPCPPRPVLKAFTIDELAAMTHDTQLKIVSNQINLKGHIKKLEVRAGCGET